VGPFGQLLVEAGDCSCAGVVVVVMYLNMRKGRCVPLVRALAPGTDYVLEVVYQATLTGVASDHMVDYYNAFDIELYTN